MTYERIKLELEGLNEGVFYVSLDCPDGLNCQCPEGRIFRIASLPGLTRSNPHFISETAS